MKNKIIWGAVFFFLCVLSGIVGAYSMMLLQKLKANGDTLQVHRLELIDAHKGVRAVFSVEDDGSVFLRMLSKENAPVVELGVNENPGPYKLYTPSGSLTIRDGESTPVIWLHTVNKGDGSLSFSSARTRDQVTVGYMPYGDYRVHDDAIWGIAVRGSNHESTGVGVRTEDGEAKEFVGPNRTSPDK